MAKTDKTTMYVLTIVGIVALTGAIAIFMNMQTTDLAGEVTKARFVESSAFEPIGKTAEQVQCKSDNHCRHGYYCFRGECVPGGG